MKKSELKSGMLVVRGNNSRAIVMKDTPSGDIITRGITPRWEDDIETTWCPLDVFKEDLTIEYDGDGLDIVEVYGYSSNMDATSLSTRDRTLLWKRDRPVELRLTSDYVATVDLQNKVVKVGCQVIPFNKVEELYKIMHSSK
jgi:hypothetical protein